jgi:hypothetical protein
MKLFKPILATIACFIAVASANKLRAQKIESIVFNLYTDSLKKGTHNYINVDGKLSTGSWLPLTTKELKFTSTGGTFEGNSLILDKDFTAENVSVTATLIQDTTLKKTVTIFVKKRGDDEKLKTAEEILRELENNGKKKKKNGR